MLEAIPADDSIFTGWGGDCLGTRDRTPLTVQVDQDLSCVATFERAQVLGPMAEQLAVTNTRTSPSPVHTGDAAVFRVGLSRLPSGAAGDVTLQVNFNEQFLAYGAASWQGLPLSNACRSSGSMVTCYLWDETSDFAIDLQFTALAIVDDTVTTATAILRSPDATVRAGPASAGVTIVDPTQVETVADLELPPLGDGTLTPIAMVTRVVTFGSLLALLLSLVLASAVQRRRSERQRAMPNAVDGIEPTGRR